MSKLQETEINRGQYVFIAIPSIYPKFCLEEQKKQYIMY